MATAALGSLSIFTSSFGSNGEIVVCLVGDSTVAEYAESEPHRGWGQYLGRHFDRTIRVVNRAVGGRSSKSFQREGRWRDVLRERPDFVLIQFGHNDAHAPGLPESTAADVEYRECLRLYIATARKAGIVPVLVSPVSLMAFNDAGQLTEPLREYARVTRSVAGELAVPMVDLHTLSAKLFKRLGKARVQELGSVPGEGIHFNALGAQAMCELVARGLRDAAPRLADRMVEPGVSQTR